MPITITLPGNAIPIFGTVSVFSLISLYLLIRALGDRTKKDLIAVFRNSEEYRADLKKAKEEAISACVSREDYNRFYARFAHMESSCRHCNPLKESSAFPTPSLPRPLRSLSRNPPRTAQIAKTPRLPWQA